MKYDGKDSVEISCDEFLEVPITHRGGESSKLGGEKFFQPKSKILRIVVMLPRYEGFLW